MLKNYEYYVENCNKIYEKYQYDTKNQLKIVKNYLNMADQNRENILNIRTFDSKNFGDGVNNTFWSYITQNKINNNKSKLHYITTGSIMCHVENNSIIFGTGFISSDSDIGGDNYEVRSNKKYAIPEKVIAVRGPLTRKKLLDFKIYCPENYGDPLILMPCLYDTYNRVENNTIGIIPHCIDKNNKNYNLLKTNLEKDGYNVKFIDIEVGNNYKKLIDSVNNCKYIISSSLHGVMMGIVYKKQTIFIEFGDSVIGGDFKFQDFFKSINVNYKNINKYDTIVLNNTINVDYDYLQKVGTKLISLIPFINDKRKEFLINKYSLFYKNIL